MSGTPRKVLVADDDPRLLRGLDLALSGRGYAVRTAADGAGLLALLETEAPDLLVLDVMMPGMTGLEVLEQIRGNARWAAVPVLIMTGVEDAAVADAAWERGASDVIAKPFRLNELMMRIEASLRTEPPPDE